MPSRRQENAFLKLGNIKGKAETKGFKDQVVFQSMSYSIHQAGQWEDGDRLSGRITTFDDLAIVKEMDISSPSLAQACAMKEQFPKAEISLVAAGKETYMKVTLEEVFITSVSVGFHSDESQPSETITMKYMKAIWEWGTAKAGYDLKNNTKV
jgi:type VI secretion system secreted protein Hcp